VNLSAANLLDLNLVGDVASMTGRYGTPHDALQLEITEDTLMVDPPRALDVLAQLSELGIRFSLDDFGTGYSSLSQLKRLPVHELKIDRCFVADMCARHEDAVIVQSTIDLAHSLGLRVVAEGVERTDQQKRLARMGCDLLQGYLVCPPVDAAGLRWWLGARDALARSNRTIG
jgi:EAL domain-containing protein (putative c-di-GMP-specific phosphodiesterase class I)